MGVLGGVKSISVHQLASFKLLICMSAFWCNKNAKKHQKTPKNAKKRQKRQKTPKKRQKHTKIQRIQTVQKTLKKNAKKRQNTKTKIFLIFPHLFVGNALILAGQTIYSSFKTKFCTSGSLCAILGLI